MHLLWRHLVLKKVDILIILATPEMKFYYIKVDPGNGEILETQQVSQKELDKMHKEHSAMVVSNNGNEGGVSGFPFIIPH
jgi:hypothetical protein